MVRQPLIRFDSFSDELQDVLEKEAAEVRILGEEGVQYGTKPAKSAVRRIAKAFQKGTLAR